MEYIKSYKSFINSYYLSEGIRKTTGILVPVFVCVYFNELMIGIIMALGAMCTSVADNPGSIRHQKNGMLVCITVIFITSIITGWAAHSTVILGIVLFIFSFLFSMLGVYGARVNAIGIAGMLILILNIFKLNYGIDILYNALYLLAGGAWYLLLSLGLYSFRPYKLAQQTLGDWIQSVAVYLQARAAFYEKDIAADAVYKNLFLQQVSVQESQNIVSDLIFKTRSISGESTHTGRVIVMIFLDAVELFERITSSYQDYNALHHYFDDTNILQQYKTLALKLAADLDEIGMALKSGRRSNADKDLQNQITNAKENLNNLRKTFLNPDNIEGFIYLRNIINNIQDIYNRIQRLHQYTTFDESLKFKQPDIDKEEFISHQDYSPKLFFNNFSLQSDVFRHSLRVCIAVLAGYIIGEWFTIGHNYWILLTIIIILKPAYSLTKKRNKDRLLGTVTGIIIGVVILTLVQNNTVLLILLMLLMAASNSLIRKNYFLSVMLMTPYVLIFFHLLNQKDFYTLLADRIIDTAIGSVIAFLASFFLLPSWEHSKIRQLMVAMLDENKNYFITMASAIGGVKQGQEKLIIAARKNVYVALANLSGTFNRMLSEPKSKQVGLEKIHQFVVLNHILASHIASLSAHLKLQGNEYFKQDFEPVAQDIGQYLTLSVACLQNERCDTEEPNDKKAIQLLNKVPDQLMEKRKMELQSGHLETDTRKPLMQVKSVVNQFNFLYSIAMDIFKISKKIKAE
ncbi:MAG TPA: FUSC family membrane protein [Chitinophagaceae bacterium]